MQQIGWGRVQIFSGSDLADHQDRLDKRFQAVAIKIVVKLAKVNPYLILQHLD